MMNRLFNIGLVLFTINLGLSQKTIPLDTLHWDINAKSYVLENFKGQEAIYLKEGSMILKDVSFLNGTIEYDIFLKDAPAFPGVYFRINDSDSEHFYLRPHQSGNPDANQAIPSTKGITPWQLYFGPKYSFPYTYAYDDWTHVKIVVDGDRAQVYLNHSEQPNLSWRLFHKAKEGEIQFTGGGAKALHIANITIDRENHEITDFKPIERKPIEGLVPQWEISDKFEEKLIQDQTAFKTVIDSRTWGKKINVEEGTAANISRQVQLYDDNPGNTVFAKITITSDKDQIKLFEFGYSDRVVVILNEIPVYRGTNRFRSRDYRYLGTVGLFDAVYLNLKKGKNTLLLAVSEDFGGWLVTGRFSNPSGIRTK
ncbi:hypothetical protein [Ulvibacterium sp.]|uniref:hypothetical protein n=1 Tax=Ulvibacterium sp. TaxID=2665914 RepID=UPI00262A5A2A|nr:hypothetical protein [Ulvibacterium sp.]